MSGRFERTCVSVAVALCAVALCAVAPWIVGCTGSEVVDPADAGPCDELLEIGRCVLPDGASCRGDEGELAAFGELSSGDSVPAVIGPQGSRMLVLAVRTVGIAPGDLERPADVGNPQLVLRMLARSGEMVGFYRGRAAFTPEGARFILNDVFVLGEPSGMVGELTATATVRDRDGVEHCGTRALVVR